MSTTVHTHHHSTSASRTPASVRARRGQQTLLWLCVAMAGCGTQQDAGYYGNESRSPSGGVVIASGGERADEADYESESVSPGADQADGDSASTVAQASPSSPSPASTAPRAPVDAARTRAMPTQRPAPPPAQATPVERGGGETFAQTRENGLMDARQDAMSTFSLDVDTASYTLARSDLTAGRLPRPESVRVRSGSISSATTTPRRAEATPPLPCASRARPATSDAGVSSCASPCVHMRSPRRNALPRTSCSWWMCRAPCPRPTSCPWCSTP